MRDRCKDRRDHFVEDDAMMSDSLSLERLAVATQLCVFQAAATNRTAVNETLRLSSNIFRFSSLNLDQNSSSESRTSINFKISTKHQHFDETQASKSWPNLASESRPRFNFITSTKHQRQNAEQTPASKSCLNFNFKILTNPCAQSLNKSLALGPNISFQICNKLLPT